MAASSAYAVQPYHDKPNIVNEQKGCGGYPIPSCSTLTRKIDCSKFYQVSSDNKTTSHSSKELSISIAGQPCAWSRSVCETSSTTPSCTNTYTSKTFGSGEIATEIFTAAFIVLFEASSQT